MQTSRRVSTKITLLLATFALCVSVTTTAQAAEVATQVTTGNTHSCELLAGGTVACWGFNGSGQLGDGLALKIDRNVPGRVTGITTATQVSAGRKHSCALLSGGTIKCWGDNVYGQLGDGTTNLGRSLPATVSSITTATQISGGWDHSCALLSGGAVKCWGNNVNGALGDGTTNSSNLPVSVSGITTAIQVTAGSSHSCAVLTGGSVKCWGYNTFGRLGDGSTAQSSLPVSVSGITTATEVSAGSTHSCALLSGGTIKCWGWNGEGELGNGDVPFNSSVPVSVSGITGATQVTVRTSHSCALLSGGAVKCWGWNGEGRLGDGTTILRSAPASVTGITTATQVTAGGSHSCALLSGGTVKCWGSNSSGALGNGTTVTSSVPMSVVGSIITPTPSNQITVAKAQSKIATALITLTTSVTVPGAGKLTQAVTSIVGRRTTTWCTTEVTTRAVDADSPSPAGVYTLTCRITKAGRDALRLAPMSLTLTTSFTPTGGTKAIKTQVVKLSRTR